MGTFIRASLVLIGVLLTASPFSDSAVRFLMGPFFFLAGVLFLQIVYLLGLLVSPRHLSATFRWNGHLPTDDEIGKPPAEKVSDDFGEQWLYQVTKPVADALFASLVERRLTDPATQPVADDHARFLRFAVHESMGCTSTSTRAYTRIRSTCRVSS